ncbi:hypothetical protein BKA65DRAFT_484853 [Rhexocercosporidium sp. MPI-PUGE-AT-0058]|nr:hypothetical protein BKA65DRAFT_484853 [Rhexocercosporidium sp. MPI-PUGE-AT-0058]
MKDKWRNGQFVWPKDSPGGRAGPNGWFGKMSDIVTGKGPDIFVARKGETIKETALPSAFSSVFPAIHSQFPFHEQRPCALDLSLLIDDHNNIVSALAPPHLIMSLQPLRFLNLARRSERQDLTVTMIKIRPSERSK